LFVPLSPRRATRPARGLCPVPARSWARQDPLYRTRLREAVGPQARYGGHARPPSPGVSGRLTGDRLLATGDQESGGGGIRTLEPPLRTTNGFRDRRIQPLC